MEIFENATYFSMGDDFMKNEIENQISFATPEITARINILDIFKKKLDMQMMTDESDDGFETDPEEDANSRLFEFYGYVASILQSKCGIHLDLNGHFSQEAIEAVYNMWIVKFHENMVNYFTRYIIENKMSLVSYFSKEDRLANMSVKATRKKYTNKMDAAIMLHLNEIVSILVEDIDTYIPDQIINALYSTNPEYYDYAKNKDLYDICYLSFDVPVFQERVRKIYENIAVRMALQTAIFDKLLPFFKEN